MAAHHWHAKGCIHNPTGTQESPSLDPGRSTAVGAGTSRERNLLARPTLDMYLPLSKFESIHRVYIALRCNHNLLSNTPVVRLAQPSSLAGESAGELGQVTLKEFIPFKFWPARGPRPAIPLILT